jgi:hypothetical protein
VPPELWALKGAASLAGAPPEHSVQRIGGFH